MSRIISTEEVEGFLKTHQILDVEAGDYSITFTFIDGETLQISDGLQGHVYELDESKVEALPEDDFTPH